MKQEKSCGAVVFFEAEGRRLYLIEKMRQGHLSLCKGHVEGAETEKETALREIREETALSAEILEGFRETTEYSPRPGRWKTVVFFLAKAAGTDTAPQPEEVTEISWLPLEKALDTLTFESDRGGLRKADAFLDRGVTFAPITPDNWRTEFSLFPEQERFVSSPDRLLARAFAYRDAGAQARLVALCGAPVGMVLWHDWARDDTYVFSQLFIDRQYQGRGIGRAAAEMALAEMTADGRFSRVSLCYCRGNETARRLYASLGFQETGIEDGDEIILRKEL